MVGFSHDDVNVDPIFYACPRGWSFNEVEPQTAGSLFLVPQIFCPNLGLSMDKHEQMWWLNRWLMWLGVSNGEILGTFYDGRMILWELTWDFTSSMRHMMERMGKFAWENLHG